MGESNILEIGTDIEARIGAAVEIPGTDGRWAVDVDDLPPGWSAELRSKQGPAYRSSDRRTFWTFDVRWQTRTILLSDTEFGRIPISDRMRPRSVRALRSILHLLAHPEDRRAGQAEEVSEFKGMLDRCLRKDQWDWLSVYRAFDRPRVALLPPAFVTSTTSPRRCGRGRPSPTSM